jgi:hypothetical protein
MGHTSISRYASLRTFLLQKPLAFEKEHPASVVDPHHFGAVPDPYSAFHPDADPYSHFHLMRIRLFTLMRIRIQIQILASK